MDYRKKEYMYYPFQKGDASNRGGIGNPPFSWVADLQDGRLYF